jgi:hypothetical protein
MTSTFVETGECIACYKENVSTYVLCSCVVHKMCTTCWTKWLVINCNGSHNNQCPRCNDYFPFIPQQLGSELGVFLLWATCLYMSILTGDFFSSLDKPCTFLCFSIYPFGILTNAIHAWHVGHIPYLHTRWLCSNMAGIFGTLLVYAYFVLVQNQIYYMLYLVLMIIIYRNSLRRTVQQIRNPSSSIAIHLTEIEKILLLPY